MSRTWALSKKQVMLIAGYSLIFPMSNLVGGTIAEVGLVLTIPFLPVAWIFGVYFVSVTGSESTYLIGVFIAVFVQVWLLSIVPLSRWQTDDKLP